MLKLFLVFISVSLLQVSNAGLTFKDCGTKNGVVKNLEVEGCTSTPCTLKKGENASMKLIIQSTISTKFLSIKCSGVMLGVPVPFPLPEPNGCNLGAVCPIQKDDENEISISLPILNEYPSLSVDVRLSFNGDNNQNIVCVQFPVKISS